MKSLAIASACLACFASSASAAILGVEWTPGQGGTVQDIVAGVGDVKTIDIVMDLIAGENLNTVAFEFEPVGGTGSVNAAVTGDIVTSLSGWRAQAELGVPPTGELGGLGVQVAAGAELPIDDFVMGPGRFVLATFDLEITAGLPGETGEIAFNDDLNVVLLGLGSIGAGFYSYNARYAGPGAPGGDYSGYYRFGIGSPATTGPFGQARNPLRVTTPEPSSLILLGVAALAIRRRR